MKPNETPICDAIAQMKRALEATGAKPERIAMGPDVYLAFARELTGEGLAKVRTFYGMRVEQPDPIVAGQFVIG